MKRKTSNKHFDVDHELRLADLAIRKAELELTEIKVLQEREKLKRLMRKNKRHGTK